MLFGVGGGADQEAWKGKGKIFTFAPRKHLDCQWVFLDWNQLFSLCKSRVCVCVWGGGCGGGCTACGASWCHHSCLQNAPSLSNLPAPFCLTLPTYQCRWDSVLSLHMGSSVLCVAVGWKSTAVLASIMVFTMP